MAVIRKGKYWCYEWRISGKKIRRASGYKVDEIIRDEVREFEEKARLKAEAELGQQEKNNRYR